ncbi:MAG: hypothetical protein CME30_03090 [Gemmatimonadetes bacterium]|nr:hypothetical protein [Gemmatimonadota bacterium]
MKRLIGFLGVQQGGRRDYKCRSRHNRRALTAGLVVSAAIHGILIFIYSLSIEDWYLGDSISVQETVTGSLEGIRVVTITETDVTETEADLPEETLEDPVMETDPVQQQINQEGSQEGADVDLRQKASEVLRVRSSDDRLWRKAQPEVFELEPAEIMELMLAGRLEIWVDSVYKAMEAENALTDWTRTDSEGRRWGVSPGRLHMGDISIPLPIYFGQNSWQRERSTRRAWEDRDIMNASSGAAVRQSWRERAEAIRRRRDRERSETVMPPDTIRK